MCNSLDLERALEILCSNYENIGELVDNIFDLLNKHRVSELVINIGDASRQFKTDKYHCETAYDKYRYGLRPGFTLFWVKRKDRIQLTKDELESHIVAYFDTIRYGDSAKLKGLKLKAIMKFSDIYEVSMTYLQKYNYIDEEGEFIIVTDCGFYKKVIVSEIEPMARYRKGIKVCELGKEAKVVFADYVKEPFDIAVIDTFGVTFKVNTEDVTIDGRTTKGKTLKNENKKRLPEKVFKVITE
jgi:hypothetical protein